MKYDLENSNGNKEYDNDFFNIIKGIQKIKCDKK